MKKGAKDAKEAVAKKEEKPKENLPTEESPPSHLNLEKEAEVKSSVPIATPRVEVSPLETALVVNGKIADFLMLPSELEQIWKSTKQKDQLIKHF